MTIRELTLSDLDNVEAVFFNSFSEAEAPLTFPLIGQLIADTSNAEVLCLGYEEADEICGVVAFSPLQFVSDTKLTAYILAPLAVHKRQQCKGIATRLIAHAKDQLAARKVDALLVYGDPAFYGRYGFSPELGKCFVPPYPLEYAFGWQALMLNDKQLGEPALEFSCVAALSDESLW